MPRSLSLPQSFRCTCPPSLLFASRPSSHAGVLSPSSSCARLMRQAVAWVCMHVAARVERSARSLSRSPDCQHTHTLASAAPLLTRPPDRRVRLSLSPYFARSQSSRLDHRVGRFASGMPVSTPYLAAAAAAAADAREAFESERCLWIFSRRHTHSCTHSRIKTA